MVLTGAVYCVSSLPYTVYRIMINMVHFEDENPFFIQFERISEYLTYLNIMSNFFIYSLTIPSFRRFLKSIISRPNTFLFIPKRKVGPACIDSRGK